MAFVCYRKEDLTIVGFSGIVLEQHTGEEEIELNVLPNYGGTADDYDYLDISDEDEQNRRGRQVSIELVDGMPTFVIGDLIPSPEQPPSEMDILGQRIVEQELMLMRLETDNQVLGHQMAQKDLEIMQLQSDNQILGKTVVDLEIRVSMGGL
ncbi:hypothetical protein [Brevibacillus panacihumi]|uniref:hypothetical protein n=1 Tax=Brevibacillus panacihumi TaxID=497735 RepID=UPI003D194B75